MTFDFWNTLVHEDGDALVPARLDALEHLLTDAGVPQTRDALTDAHAAAFACYQAEWVAGRQFVVEDAAAVMTKRLGLGEGLVGTIQEAFLLGGRNASLELCEGAAECLATLRAGGLKTAIICDIGLTPSSVLMEWLDHFNLLESFDALVFSDVAGSYKPDPAVFSMALAGMGGLEPRCVAHVGDRRRTDIAGAARAGLLPVRYRGVFDDLDETLEDAPVVVDHLANLPRALERRWRDHIGVR